MDVDVSEVEVSEVSVVEVVVDNVVDELVSLVDDWVRREEVSDEVDVVVSVELCVADTVELLSE